MGLPPPMPGANQTVTLVGTRGGKRLSRPGVRVVIYPTGMMPFMDPQIGQQWPYTIAFLSNLLLTDAQGQEHPPAFGAPGDRIIWPVIDAEQDLPLEAAVILQPAMSSSGHRVVQARFAVPSGITAVGNA